MRRRLRSWLACGLIGLAGGFAFEVCAGGSGLNTVVVANLNSSNSCELANYYSERRMVPPENVLGIWWAGGNVSWFSDEFQASLLNPLLSMLADRQLTNQIDYVVLSMDIPFETINTVDGSVNSTTSALFYGFRSGGGGNSYAGSEAVFSQARPSGSPGYSFLATMITQASLAEAKAVIDQGVDSDGTFPPQPVILAKSSDMLRNIRFASFDNAIFNVNIRGASSILRTNADSLWSQATVLGYQTGLANFIVPPGTFVPGAMADSLTSFGGVIFGPNGQTSLLAFLSAGAAGSYGTVAEPANDPLKFPDPQAYFYQSRGFSLAESYYQSLTVPRLGLVVGEPLAAPFRQTGWGEWSVSNTVLSGTARLPLSFWAIDVEHPLQQVDLFVDGRWFGTLTNLAPPPGNLVTVTLNGYPVAYSVPTNATVGSIATGLTAAINTPAITNVTRVIAYVHGDRIELHSISTNASANSFLFNDFSATNTTPPDYRVSFLPPSFPPQMTLTGRDTNGALHLHIATVPNLPIVIQTSSNLADWFPLFTFPNGGPVDYSDPDTTDLRQRFYRVAGQAGTDWLGPGMPPVITPSVTVLGGPGPGGCLIQIGPSAWPYTIESSTDASQWIPICTNIQIGQLQVAATSFIGSASTLGTFLVASRPSFVDSAAFGWRQYKVPNASPQVGDWIGLTITRTNGAIEFVAVTNAVSGASSATLTAQLYDLVNADPLLQGSDGVVAEDFKVDAAQMAWFNLRARSPGLLASGIQVLPGRSGSTRILQPYLASLNQNLSDLQARNHLYVTAGRSALEIEYDLDSTTLADGYHELTAVAYEGTSVRTQTKISLPVQVTNSPLSATMTLNDIVDPALVEGTYHIEVAANTNTVSLIQLYSTGGLLGAFNNQATATFTFSGSALGAGLHPFYALVETADGKKYRTQTQYVRLVHSQ
jgi:uncharacterized protein (TIGR03790 family)